MGDDGVRICPKSLETGYVYLVGAGPGDPELLTLRAYRLFQEVDVLVYDRLVSQEILDLVPARVERVAVGKKPGQHCIPQERINLTLVSLASAGKRVLRLKGGDPYIFGRGGEEAEVLMQTGIPFEVVPGITAAAGASTYCGIPLTHRDYAQSVTFATGHLKDDSHNLDWSALARSHTTLVIYMGMGSLEEIASQLVAHGRAINTPVAAVHRATQAEQEVVVGSLADIAERVNQAKLRTPSLIIVGEVVSLYNKLNVERPQSEKHPLYAVS